MLSNDIEKDSKNIVVKNSNKLRGENVINVSEFNEKRNFMIEVQDHFKNKFYDHMNSSFESVVYIDQNSHPLSFLNYVLSDKIS